MGATAPLVNDGAAAAAAVAAAARWPRCGCVRSRSRGNNRAVGLSSTPVSVDVKLK